jgi:hypothetical protein
MKFLGASFGGLCGGLHGPRQEGGSSRLGTKLCADEPHCFFSLPFRVPTHFGEHVPAIAGLNDRLVGVFPAPGRVALTSAGKPTPRPGRYKEAGCGAGAPAEQGERLAWSVLSCAKYPSQTTEMAPVGGKKVSVQGARGCCQSDSPASSEAFSCGPGIPPAGFNGKGAPGVPLAWPQGTFKSPVPSPCPESAPRVPLSPQPLDQSAPKSLRSLPPGPQVTL